MNAKPISINNASSFRFFLICGVIGIASLSFVHGLNTIEASKASSPINIDAPPAYAIKSLRITSPSSGMATITIDELILSISFDFESYEDSYGVAGSEFTNVEITNLAVEKIASVSGTEFPDFTEHTDHKQINAMITSYVLQHRLVEGV